MSICTIFMLYNVISLDYTIAQRQIEFSPVLSSFRFPNEFNFGHRTSAVHSVYCLFCLVHFLSQLLCWIDLYCIFIHSETQYIYLLPIVKRKVKYCFIQTIFCQATYKTAVVSSCHLSKPCQLCSWFSCHRKVIAERYIVSYGLIKGCACSWKGSDGIFTASPNKIFVPGFKGQKLSSPRM